MAKSGDESPGTPSVNWSRETCWLARSWKTVKGTGASVDVRRNGTYRILGQASDEVFILRIVAKGALGY